MELLEELKNLKNRKIEIETELENKIDFKIGDKVRFLYYECFLGYKIIEAEIIDINITVCHEIYSFELLLSNGEKELADKKDIEITQTPLD